jgi:gliding motility-associated-like protein
MLSGIFIFTFHSGIRSRKLYTFRKNHFTIEYQDHPSMMRIDPFRSKALCCRIPLLLMAELLLFLNNTGAQFPSEYGNDFLPNPSFEGPGGENVPPPYWIPCNNFSTPDRQPNQVDVHLAPSDGEAYISMRVRGNYPASHVNTREHVYSRLLNPLQQGNCYTMSVDLAHDDMAIYFGILTPSYPTIFRVWGSDGCDTTELLAVSPVIDQDTWKTYELMLAPREDTYDYIFIEPFYAADTIYHGLLLVDNIQLSYASDQYTIMMDTLVWPGSEVYLHPSESDYYEWPLYQELSCYYCRNPYIIVESDQVYTVRLNDGTQCPQKESFVINILTCEKFYPISSFTKLDTTLDDFTTIRLQASKGYEYAWSPEDILSCSDCIDPLVTVNRPTMITCTLTDEHNCSFDEIFKIHVKLTYPNVITPNGDGKNEVFTVKGLPENTFFSVFDRKGVLVYEADNYRNDWRGNDSMGKPLPKDTYWFVLSNPGLNILTKDFILLIR